MARAALAYASIQRYFYPNSTFLTEDSSYEFTFGPLVLIMFACGVVMGFATWVVIIVVSCLVRRLVRALKSLCCRSPGPRPPPPNGGPGGQGGGAEAGHRQAGSQSQDVGTQPDHPDVSTPGSAFLDNNNNPFWPQYSATLVTTSTGLMTSLATSTWALCSTIMSRAHTLATRSSFSPTLSTSTQVTTFYSSSRPTATVSPYPVRRSSSGSSSSEPRSLSSDNEGGVRLRVRRPPHHFVSARYSVSGAHLRRQREEESAAIIRNLQNIEGLTVTPVYPAQGPRPLIRSPATLNLPG